LGLVRIQNSNQEIRNTTITEFPFTNKGAKLISEISLKNLAIEKYDGQEFSSKYESLIIAGNLGGWEYKIDNGDLWCSKEYFKILGYNTSSLKRWEKYDVQKVWVDLIHPDDVVNARAYFAQYLTHLNGGYRQEFRMKHADGNWIWISSKGTVMFEEIDGEKMLMVIGTHTDISESKRLEIALLESNKKILTDNAFLKSIINSPEDIFILSIDTEYRYTSFSNSYKKFTKEKFGKDIFVGYKVLDLFSDAQMAIFKPALDAALRGEYNEITVSIPLNSNHLTHVHNKYNPIQNQDGKIIGVTVFVHDITKEKNAEIANKINELRYASLFSGAMDAIFIANVKTGIIVDANLKASELMGYKKSELITMHYSELHPAELKENISNKFKKFTTSNHYTSGEGFIQTKTGKTIPVFMSSGSPFQIGEDIFIAAFFKDITTRVRINEELKKQNKQLKEIAWTQSHVVRAPLTRLMGLVNALDKGIVPDCDKSSYLKHIKNSSDELDTVIKQITALTIENNRIPVDQSQLIIEPKTFTI
jgi:PAS domain S-box-containing protein